MNDIEAIQKIIDRMDAAAAAVDVAANKLAEDLETAQLMLSEDRVQIARLLVLNQRLSKQLDKLLDGQGRLEQTTVEVAGDLAASIDRADHAPSDVPGAGADAALRSGETP